MSCSSRAALEAEGGTCALATDCAEGLVCIQGQCSDDLSKIQSTETEGGSDAGMGPLTNPADGGAGMSDATMAGDVGTGSPPDSGVPPQDSGPPLEDSGSPAQDAATPPPPDAGSPADAGSG